MNRTLHNAARWSLLGLAVAVVVAAFVALACGPATPGGQAGGEVEGTPTPTVEAEATATIAATNTPEATVTPESTDTPTPEATTTPEPTATPTPAPTPRLLSPVTETMYRLTEQAGQQDWNGAGGASDGPQLPDEVRVTVNTSSAHEQDLLQYLLNNGATEIRDTDFGLTADIPPLLLGSVIRHPAFRSGYTGSGLYPRMVPWLDEYLTMYAAGELTAAEVAKEIHLARGGGMPSETDDWVYDVRIVLDAPESGPAVRKYLSSNGAFLHHPPTPGEKEFLVEMRVSLFDGMYRQPGVALVYADFLPGPGPLPEPSSGAVGQSGHATPEPTPTRVSGVSANDYPNLGPILRARLAKYQAGQADGATGQAGEPEVALVAIETSHREEVAAFLESHDITPLETVHGGPALQVIAAHFVVEVPISFLPQLAAQRIGTIRTANPYRHVSSHVNALMVEYQAGLLHEDADFLWLSMSPSEGAQFNDLKQFLESNGALILPGYYNPGFTTGSFDVFVPPPLLERLVLRPEPTRIDYEGGPFTSELIQRGLDSLRGLSPDSDAPLAEPTRTSKDASGVSAGQGPNS